MIFSNSYESIITELTVSNPTHTFPSLSVGVERGLLLCCFLPASKGLCTVLDYKLFSVHCRAVHQHIH